MNRKKLIRKIIDTAYNAKEGHIASSLSILNLLYVLYDKVLTDGDNFILSKGHASLGLYAILDEFDLLCEPLSNFCKFDSKLGGHPSNKIPNVIASTGSLGHGLPIGVGMALADKIRGMDRKTIVIIGDGESNEGSIWESALLAGNHNLNNLYCILDHNHSNDRAVKMDNTIENFKSFNWNCLKINGHNNIEIETAFEVATSKPMFILAETIKGYGCKRMENNPEWHHKSPTKEEYDEIINEIENLEE